MKGLRPVERGYPCLEGVAPGGEHVKQGLGWWSIWVVLKAVAYSSGLPFSIWKNSWSLMTVTPSFWALASLEPGLSPTTR